MVPNSSASLLKSFLVPVEKITALRHIKILYEKYFLDVDIAVRVQSV